VRRRAEADKVDDVRATGVAIAPSALRRPARGWLLLSGAVVFLLLGALFLGTPVWSEVGTQGFVCGDDAALTLVFRPPPDTSPACRELAIEDTILGGALVVLGFVYFRWWRRRRRRSVVLLDHPVDQ
jgi:hypothetical protein